MLVQTTHSSLETTPQIQSKQYLFSAIKAENLTGPSEDTSQDSVMLKSYGNQYKVYDIDERAAKKPIGPRTAAEIVAFHQSRAPTSNYRAEREALDAQRSKEKAAKNLDRRWKRAKSAQRESETSQRVPKAPQPTRPPSSMIKSSETGNPSFSQPTVVRSHKTKPKPSALFQSTINAADFGGISANRPFSRQNNLTGSPSVCSDAASESVPNLLSEPQRQKLLREQKNRDLEQKAARDKEKREAYNARQRKKKAEEAREGHRHKLIEVARADGREISDADLNAELEAFMAEREVRSVHLPRDKE